MFTIYHSNSADSFKELLINTMIDKSLSDPMQSEVILTEYSNIIDQWIQIELSKVFGVVFNIKFMTLTYFIQNISNKILFNNSIILDLSRSAMYWKFMEILSCTKTTKNFSVISKYLSNDINQRKISQFSEQLADLFSQYLMYRPDWLDAWQSNRIIDDLDSTHQIWQSKMWRIFINNILSGVQELNDNNVNPLQYCINYLKNTRQINCDLPNRIFIFGITSIPPIYWTILKLLSCHIDIYLWFINPCSYNWKHVLKQNASFITQYNQLHKKNSLCSSSYISNRISNDNNYVHAIHPLLNFWGNVGRDTACVLTQLTDTMELKSFKIPKKDSLLHIIQSDILECYNNVINEHIQCDSTTTTSKQHDNRYALKSEDQSITFHICHSIQREVEILHDHLLSMITSNPLLSPGDIVVMATDIHCYIPAIQSVFHAQGRHLPFAIACKYKNKIHPIISTFLKILNLSCSRFTAEDILSFLTVSSVASRFDINKEEVQLLRKWIIESGIRWGLDEITMHNLDLPINNKNTWYFGLTRMLMGYAIKNQHEIWENIAPYNHLTGEHINIVGQLGKFLKTLKKWRNRFNKTYILTEWISYFKEIIDDFFYSDYTDTEDNKILLFLKNCCLNILELGIQSNYTQTLHIIALRDKLYNKLTQNTATYQFLPDAINFCNITPTRCIPCKVVCFLGMNSNKFPRNNISPDFNLIIKNPRKNDDNIYYKDCYAFLLALLLAQERIYISFIGHSIYDNTIINSPSVLIDELAEYIAQNFYLIEYKTTNIDINIKYIRQNLYQWHDPFPFSSNNFNPDGNKQSFADEWLPAANIDNIHNSQSMHLNFNTPLPHYTTKKIMFQDLYNFYRHPIRVWFQKRLNVYFDQNTPILLNQEPFSVDGLNNYELSIKLVDYLINNKDTDKLYNEICVSGILPYGAFGELYWIKQHKKMTILANQIKKYHRLKKSNLDISLEFDVIKLVGELTVVQDNGLVRWTPKNISMKDVLLLWLEHITYCSIGGNGDSRLFSINDMWHFPNFSMLQAKELLLILILGYCNGMNTPLFLLYHSGGAWINHIFNWDTKTISLNESCQKEAYRKLIQSWKGTKYSFYRESNDPYLRKLIPLDLSTKNIAKIIENSKHYFFNVLKYRITR